MLVATLGRLGPGIPCRAYATVTALPPTTRTGPLRTKKAKVILVQEPVYVSLSQFITPRILAAASNATQTTKSSSSTGSGESLLEDVVETVPLEKETLQSDVAPVEPVVVETTPAKVEVTNETTDSVVALDPTVFAHPVRTDILHRCVVHHLDSLRQGSANTKTRGEVRGSGHKIRPQKGTGRARLGDKKSPMLRGGGVAFGPHPRDFSTKLPRKVIQMGMRVALSAKVQERSLGVVESLNWPLAAAKTKLAATRIDELGWRRTLFVTGEAILPEGLRRSMSNLVAVDTIKAEDLTVYDAVRWPRLVLDVAAVSWFEQVLSKGAVAGGLAEVGTQGETVATA